MPLMPLPSHQSKGIPKILRILGIDSQLVEHFELIYDVRDNVRCVVKFIPKEEQLIQITDAIENEADQYIIQTR